MTSSSTLVDVKKAHSPLGASSSYRWFECPGSIFLISNLPPSTPSHYALEGTEAHTYLADILLGKTRLELIPEKFKEPLRIALDVIRTQIADAKVGDPRLKPVERGLLYVEKRFDLSHIHTGLYGTADIVIVDKIKKLLTVADYKHGSGIAVSVENNSQLLYYALGAYTSLESQNTIEKIKLQIIQPRIQYSDPVQSWEITPVELFDFAFELKEKAIATEKEDAALKQGEHCRFCPAINFCPEVKKLALLEAANDFKEEISLDVEDKKVNLKVPSTGAEYKKALNWLPTLQAWIKAVKEGSYRYAMQGEKIPGYKLVEKRKTRRWIDDSEMVALLEKHNFKEDEIFEPRKVKSVAQFEKQLPSKNDRDFLQSFIIAESSGLALVDIHDKREAIEIDPLKLAQLDFQNQKHLNEEDETNE